jgi:hypothetical protein
MNKPTLDQLIAIEDAALTAFIAYAEQPSVGMERYESPEYRRYMRAVKAVNKARGY